MTHRDRKVLVTEANYQHSLAAARALAASGHEVHMLGRRFSQGHFSRFPARNHIFMQSGSRLVDQIAAVSLSHNLNFLLPIGAGTTFEVSEARVALEERMAFALAPLDSMRMAMDKARLLEFARGIGLYVPEAWSFSSFHDFAERVWEIPVPFVIKSASEMHKFGPLYVKSEEDLEEIFEVGVLLPEFLHGELVVQRLITGPGEGFFALYQEGVCKRMMMHQRVREYPESGGSSWAARSIHQKDLQDMGMKLLDSLNWHGPAMVEFKRDLETGKPALIELNPKFWGSLDLSITAGVDFPSDTVRVAAGEMLSPNFDYRKGVLFVWPLQNLTGFVRDKDLREMGFSTNISLRDIGPSFISLLTIVASVMARWLASRRSLRILIWSTKYDAGGFLSRVIGEIFGIPLKRHCELNRSLWVGAKPGPLGRWLLGRKHFKVVSLIGQPGSKTSGTANESLLERPLPEFVEIPLDTLHGLAEEISSLRASEHKVFIHCREGVGRAPTVAAAVLILEGQSLSQALEMLSEKRSIVSINHLQLSSLKAFEEHVRVRKVSA